MSSSFNANKICSNYKCFTFSIPGYQAKSSKPVPEDWKSGTVYSLASSMRHSYQEPCQKKDLKGNVKRYGCNKLKNTPAHGIGEYTVSSDSTNCILVYIIQYIKLVSGTTVLSGSAPPIVRRYRALWEGSLFFIVVCSNRAQRYCR